MSDRKWKALTVPYEVIAADDSETQCYRLSGKTVAMLLAMIEYMEWRTRWHKPDGSLLRANDDAEIDNIKTWSAQAAYELMTPETCFDDGCEEGDCTAYYPNHPSFTWSPNDPFNPTGTAPAGYLREPLYTGLSSALPGSQPNDVYCDILSVLPTPPFGLIEQITQSGFPRVRMEFTGSGEIEVHLVAVPQGGLAVIRLDETAYVSVVNLSGYSLNDISPSLDFLIDVIAGIADWKVVNETIHEIPVPAGDHTLDILFIPNLSINLLQNGWGGGLRNVVLCGEFTVTSCPETIIDPIGGGGSMPGLFDICWLETDDGRVLRYTINGGCTWNVVGSCNGGEITVPPDEGIITDPEDDDGNIPEPDDDPNARCKIAVNAFGIILGTENPTQDLYQLSVTALTGSATELGFHLLNWLQSRHAQMGLSYMQYFDKYKALLVKYYPHSAAIFDQFDSALHTDNLCMIYDCIPAAGGVGREVLDCIADGFEAQATPVGSNAFYYYSYIADFLRIYPVEWAKHRAFAASNLTSSFDCTTCSAPPDPMVCGIYQEFDWRDHPLEQTLGWSVVEGGTPGQWAVGDADFNFSPILFPMQKGSGNWRLTQLQNTVDKIASFVEYEFDEPFNLCELYTYITNSHTKYTQRHSVAWYQTVSGLWIPLAGVRHNAGKSGSLSVSWTGATVEAKKILVGGTVGTGTWQLHAVYLNSSLA